MQPHVIQTLFCQQTLVQCLVTPFTIHSAERNIPELHHSHYKSCSYLTSKLLQTASRLQTSGIEEMVSALINSSSSRSEHNGFCGPWKINITHVGRIVIVVLVAKCQSEACALSRSEISLNNVHEHSTGVWIVTAVQMKSEKYC